MAPEAFGLLRQLSLRESHYDANWVSALDAYDEPPLFTRVSDVQFLADISMPERGQMTVAWALEVLDTHARFLSALPTGNDFFLCLTFMDWDLVASGERPVPTPCLFVSPRASDELLPSFVLVPAIRPFGRALESWIAPLNRGRGAGAELAGSVKRS
jgi:hypothetical protein